MDSKLITGIIVALVMGFGIGYIVFNSNTELNQAHTEIEIIQTTYNTLQSEYDEIESSLQELSADYDALEEAHQSLDDQYVELEQNNVAKSEYDELYDLYTTAVEEKDTIENELSLLLGEYEVLESRFTKLNIDYDELSSEYQMVNGPQSEFASIDDLQITLTTEKTVYNYTESILGTVSITYLSGDPFKGSVSFTIRADNYGSTSGYNHNLNGETNYRIGTPTFRYGPGIYTIQLNTIYDEDGFIVVSYNELESISITLEAK